MDMSLRRNNGMLSNMSDIVAFSAIEGEGIDAAAGCFPSFDELRKLGRRMAAKPWVERFKRLLWSTGLRSIGGRRESAGWDSRGHFFAAAAGRCAPHPDHRRAKGPTSGGECEA